MKRMPSAKTGAIGVTRTQLAVQERLGWLFREQFNDDYGIDAQVEVVAGDRVLGRLLALQIKSGPSWFKEPTVDGWWFRPERKHVSYWTSHSLPVVVVLYDESSESCHLAIGELRHAGSRRRWRLEAAHSAIARPRRGGCRRSTESSRR
jgi:hypothetical protein